MKSFLTTEKLLALFLWTASLSLLGSMNADEVQQKTVQGKDEAAAIAAEMSCEWQEYAKCDAAVFLEAAICPGNQ